MKLPAEIRLKILRELLWHPEPLTLFYDDEFEPMFPPWSLSGALRRTGVVVRRTNYAFHPAILAVCRTLNQEGTPVLYEENTVDVTIKEDRSHSRLSVTCDWMGSERSLIRVSETLNAKARRLRITIQVSSNYQAKTIRVMLRDVVGVLQANPQWCSLDFHLERLDPKDKTHDDWSDEWSDEEDEIRVTDEEILRPLSLLRRLKDVDFSGVCPHFAAGLIEVMKSDCPVVDLPKMFNNLDYYTDSIFADDPPLESSLDEVFVLAQNAMDEGNEAEFYKYRNKVMWEIDKIRSQELVDVFKHDPDPMASSLSNSDFIREQRHVEYQQTEQRLAVGLQTRIAETQEQLRLRK